MSTEWKNLPLYAHLMACLPAFVTETKTPGCPPARELNVKLLHQALNMSHEGVYKWLRAGRLKPENAEAIVDLAGRHDGNVALLAAAGLAPPKFEDFTDYFRRRSA